MSYFDDNEDYLIHNSRPTPKKKKFFIEDYTDVKREVNPCPECGKAPERNNCGSDYQAVSCYDCGIHAGNTGGIFISGGGQAKLLSAIGNWNEGKFDKEDIR